MFDSSLARYYKCYASARLLVLIIVSLGVFLLPLAITASLIAVPTIAVDLQANGVLVSWIPAVFILSSLIAQLPGGRLADLFGRKRIFVIGYAVFALGGAMGALAPNIEWLLVSRVFQGIGGAIGTSAGMAMLSTVYQAKGRGAALGWMTSSAYLGMSSGPLIGGWIVDQLGWRAVFWVPVPIAILVVAAAVTRIRGEWCNQDRHYVDWLGVVLLALALSGLFFGITRVIEWTGVLLALAGVLFVYLFVKRCAAATYPLVRIDLIIQNKTFLRSVLAALFMYSSHAGIVFMMTLYLQYNRGMTPTEAGQILMLQAVMMTLFAPIAGRLSDLWGSRVLATVGCLLIAGGLALLLQISPQMPLWLIATAIMVMGVGHGLFSTPNNASAIATVTSAKLGIATAILSLARQSGQLMGNMVLSLLIAIYFSGRAITHDSYEDLQSVAGWAIGMALLFSLIAAWFSSRKATSG